MSATEEQIPTTVTAVAAATDDVAIASDTATTATAAATADAVVDQERSEKILKAKELYSRGSRNYLVKNYDDAADELGEVCTLYEQLHGELSDELGMPYLLYAKSLIALALDENKVIDVPDEEDDDNNDEDDDDDDNVDDDDDDEELEKEAAANGEAKGAAAATNGKKLDAIEEVSNDDEKKKDEADSTAEKESASSSAKVVEKAATATASTSVEEAQVSSTNDAAAAASASAKVENTKNGDDTSSVNGKSAVVVAASSSSSAVLSVMDGEKPSTSNGAAGGDNEEEENEAASSLQLAWEILELAAKIFSRQGLSGLPNLAEVQTELANIEFENNILEAAREDYEKALKIYGELPTNYRRAMAEIHYKIGLTYLMQQLNKEGAESLKEACKLIEGEIEEIKAKKDDLTEKDTNNIQDMEETKQEIWAKIAEIEDTQAQNIAEVRAALDSYIKPMSSQKNADGAGTSSAAASAEGAISSGNGAASSSSAITSSSKPTDITHLIKRKKPDEISSEAEASPAKRPHV